MADFENLKIETIEDILEYLEEAIQRIRSKIRAGELNIFPLTYSNERSMSAKTKFYTLALILISNQRLNFTRLDLMESKFLKIFISELETSGRFMSQEETAKIMQVPVNYIYNNIKKILNKLSSGIYILRSDGNLEPLESNNALEKILKLYEENENLPFHPDLTDEQKSYLLALRTARISPGIYQSFHESTKYLNKHRTDWYVVIEDAYDRVTNGQNLFDSQGNRISKNEARLKLLPYYLNPNFRYSLRTEEVQLIDLLMTKSGKRFTYSYSDIVRILNIKGKDPELSLRARIYRIVCKLEG